MKKIGVLIHPEELDAFWVEEILANKIDVLGLHPIGGASSKTRDSLKRLIELQENEGFQNHLKKLKNNGVEIEYAFHGISYLMPEALFDAHPDWFRMNQEGKRVADGNYCVSNQEAMQYLSDAVEKLAKILIPSNHRYHIWQNDVHHGGCCCAACRLLSRADQSLVVDNAIVQGLRRVDPAAMQCHLAYGDTLEVPSRIVPEDGIYLEYAPISRDHTRPLGDLASEKNRESVAPLSGLLNYFGHAHATALDYWLDNSLFSEYKKPPEKLSLHTACVAEDARMYAETGMEYITTFACYLGEDYRALYGAPPIKPFMELVNRSV